ncbi:MAG: hypothetical protein ACFFA6_06000 [Promethearchaeota archaeon]
MSNENRIVINLFFLALFIFFLILTFTIDIFFFIPLICFLPFSFKQNKEKISSIPAEKDLSKKNEDKLLRIKYCSNCRTKILDINAKYCAQCGIELKYN